MNVSNELVASLFNNTPFLIGYVMLVIWSLVWKGIALWKSAQNRQRNWFIVLLILNTFGILEILYLFYFVKKSTNTIDNG